MWNPSSCFSDESAARTQTDISAPNTENVEDYVRRLLSNGGCEGAFEWLQQAIAKNPQDHQARLIRAVLVSQRYATRGSRGDLEKVAETTPFNGNVLQARVMLSAIHDPADRTAVQMLRNLANIPGEGYWAARFVGKLLAERKQYSEVIEVLDPVVAASNKPDPWLLSVYTLALSRRGETKRAVALMRKAAEMLPLSSIYRGLAATLYRHGDIPAADEALRKRVSLLPNKSDPLDLFLDSLQAENDRETIMQRYEYVMESALAFPYGRYGQALLYAQIPQTTDEAISILEDLAASSSRTYRALSLRRLAGMYLKGDKVAGDLDHAKTLFEQASALGSAPAAEALAYYYYDAPRRGPRDLEKAHHYYNQARYRGRAYAHYQLGNMYFAGRGVLMDREKALTFFLRSMQTGYAASHSRAAEVLLSEHHLWNPAAAVAWAEIGAQQIPEDSTFSTLTRVYLKCEDLEAAEDAWKRWLDWRGKAGLDEGNMPPYMQRVKDRLEQQRTRTAGGDGA